MKNSAGLNFYHGEVCFFFNYAFASLGGWCVVIALSWAGSTTFKSVTDRPSPLANYHKKASRQSISMCDFR